MTSKITPAALADAAFERVSFFTEPTDIGEFLVHLAQDIVPDMSELVAYEQLLNRRDTYVRELIKRQTEASNSGIFCPYEVVKEQNLIVGYSHPRAGDSEEKKKLRNAAPLHQSALRSIRNITPSLFESFCSKLLKLMGAQEEAVTQVSRDGGLDFLARIPFQPNYFLSDDFRGFEAEFQVLVLGQAKAYGASGVVGIDAIRELIGVGAMFHSNVFSSEFSAIGERLTHEHRLCDPLILSIMTTGQISSVARDAARRYGVVAKDGAQIATFLCTKEIGVDLTGAAPSFSNARLENWINSE